MLAVRAWLVPLGAVALLVAGAGLAEPVRDVVATSIDGARRAWAKHNAADTVRALEQALLAARDKAPLELRQAVVVHEPHTGLGLFTPAAGDVVIGRDLKLYVEVANAGLVQTEAGAASALEVEGDFTFEDTSAGPVELVPLGVRKLGAQRSTTRTPTGLQSFGLDVRLGERSPAGVYRMTLKVTDLNKKQSAARDVRFVLR